MIFSITLAAANSMNLRVNLTLGSGNLKTGFPHIIAEVKTSGVTENKFIGSLPSAPAVEEMQRRWKAICDVQVGRINSRIKIKKTGKTNFSEDDPAAVYQGLNAVMNEWLASEGFHREIEERLRNAIGTIDSRSTAFEIFLESSDPEIWELPWDAWKFRKDYQNCEIVKSSSQYKKYPKQATVGGMPLPSRGRILCVWGNSQGIDLKKDKKSIEKSVGHRCELEFLKQPAPEALRAYLLDERNWQILYYGGHSNRNATHGWLDINQTESDNTVTVEYLKDSLEQSIFKGLELLILNSCSSLGLAADLVAGGLPLPATIVMRAPIPDEIAHDFVKFLFKYLGNDVPLFLAVRKAKDDLRKWESVFPGASSIPVLCQQPIFEGITLPQKVDRPAETAVNIASDFPQNSSALPSNNQLFVFPSNLLRKIGICLATTASTYMLLGPTIAPLANKIGMEKHRKNQPLIAGAYYNLATFTNLNYAQPYYNLSILCDDLNDEKCASDAMQQAAWRGLPDAYAQRSRSLLLENKLDRALKAIALCLEHTKHDGVKSACFKNRGWVRLKQNQYKAAEIDLKTAIAIDENSPEAQCLLARVLEIKGQPQQALAHWQKTLKDSDSSIPEQDECLQIAKQRLQTTLQTIGNKQ
ncbi:MAG: CHAT domain-containing tetratricopeptide repeat protein [Microcoleus sp.]